MKLTIPSTASILSLFCYFGAERLGEAFLDKASGLHIKFVARMLRPYKNRDSFPEITKQGSYQIRVDNPLIRPLAKVD